MDDPQTKVDPEMSHGQESEDDSFDDLKKENLKESSKVSGHHHEHFNMREVIFYLPGGAEIRFNPFVSLIAIVLLWGVSIWCMVEPDKASDTLIDWRSGVAELFTWFYVGTNPAFMFFMIYLAFRFRNIKLGPKDSEPDFDDVTYFAMLFSAGIGVGLFFFGVSEPLWHQSSHWYAQAGYHNQDEIDMFALNLTVFHWGITGWSQYLVVAVCAGLASYRFNLPFTLRSCFYPILGEYTWGWIGDILDGFTIVTNVAGVCTSLGLGAFQLAAGLKFVGAIDEDISEDKLQSVHVISIWIITCIATASVVSGLNIGIKYLSQFGFGLGMILLFVVFVLEKTNYILNLVVQEIGWYLQYSVLLLNFQTDVFGQLNPGEGRATDGKAAATWWMASWTIFYIGWWVAWAAFVGLFIARISRGRTIGSIVVFSYIAPLLYTILWFSVFGGTGLRQARQALELQDIGQTYFNNSEYYLEPGSTYCYEVPQEDVEVDGTTVFTNTLLGVTPVCEFNSAESDFAWFNVLNSFSYPLDFETGFGPFLCWLSLFALAIYFITSSDSGSLIVDHLASNGFEKTHWIQRVFWAFTEGAVATALLVAGGSKALRALQAASILSGLPFTLFLCFMCLSIYKMCNLAENNDKSGVEKTLKEEYHEQRLFQTPIFGGVFNVFEHIFSFGRPHPIRADTMPLPSQNQVNSFFIALCVPFVPLYKIYSLFSSKPESKTGNLISTAIYASGFIMWIALFSAMPSSSRGLRGFAWCAMFFNGCILCNLRANFRARYNIVGNLLSDFTYSTLFWPQVLNQMLEELESGIEKEEVDL